MKKLLSFMLVGLISANILLIANANSEPTPELIKAPIQVPVTKQPVTATPFEVEISGQQFKIFLNENPSTGYIWQYEINNSNHVSFTEQQFVAGEDNRPGAGGKKEFVFTVNTDGVSTINFSLQRAWEDNAVNKLNILVYKKEETVIVEEDQVVYALDKPIVDVTQDNNKTVSYNDNVINDTTIKQVNNVNLVPLRSILENMGYEVKWKSDTKSIEILKGAQWTSITLENNSYFRNRMAPWELSAAPTVINDITYVPIEFFVEILGKGIQVENRNIKFNDEEMAIHQGHVKAIDYDETGAMRITITKVKDSNEINDEIILHTANAYTYINKTVAVGDHIKAICPPIMAMSIPAQTSAVIIY